MSKPTVFILAGGNDRTTSGYGKRLANKIAKHASRPRILSCFFSAPESEWAHKAKDWKEWFLTELTQPFTYDYAKPATFLEQMDAADVIYFHGGDTELLFKTLPDVATLKAHFSGKIVVGSSAGANMLSTHYWSSSRGVLGEGLSILDVNIMVHYGSDDKRIGADWKQEEAEFKKLIGTDKILRLPEGRFVVIEGENITLANDMNDIEVC